MTLEWEFYATSLAELSEDAQSFVQGGAFGQNTNTAVVREFHQVGKVPNLDGDSIKHSITLNGNTVLLFSTRGAIKEFQNGQVSDIIEA